MLFTLFNVAKHPRVQQKIVDEIHKVFGGAESTETTLHKLTDMHYLDMVIRESLRLYPTIPIIGRKVLEETEISKLYFQFVYI